MPSYLCECRGPCRRSFEITHDTYSWLRRMGAVLTPECAWREERTVVYRYNGCVVVGVSIGTTVSPPRPSVSL